MLFSSPLSDLRVTYDVISLGRINIPDHMFPQTHYPTAISELNSDNPTVMNVLIDMVIFLI